ncbi:unnamed protein product, partial [Didymodactylos carnosus]
TEVTDSLQRPAIATGSVSLKVSRDSYKLNVLINTKKTDELFTPSSIIHTGVDVTQHTNNAAVDNVEVCLIIVDEAILSLTGHTLLSPLDIFYPDRLANIIHYHGRASECMACSGGDGGEQIAVRSNFNPLAHWIPSAIANSSRHATSEIKLPDNLTRYRVWALAANDKQYGLSETSFTVQLPVMVRPSPPRFLNYGDIAHFLV